MRALTLIAFIGALIISPAISQAITLGQIDDFQTGTANWMEGAQLLGVYVLLALAFFFLPA